MRSLKAVCGWVSLFLFLSGAASAAPHTVIVGGDNGIYGGVVTMFNPSTLTIQAGDTVTFTNAGGLHNVAADDGSFRCANGCDGQGGNGDPSNANWSTTITFGTAGTFGYHCEVHASLGMTGTITVEGATAPPPFNMDQHGLSGSWANPATDSQGLVMELYPDIYGNGSGLLFGGWFTYDVNASGGQRWYTVQGTVGSTDDSATMPIYLTQGGAFDTAQATATAAVGQATLHFDDCSHGTLAYTFSDGSGRTGTIPLTRLLQNVTCGASGDNGAAASSYLLGGTWADTGNSGQGLVIDINPPMNVMFAAWYTFLADADPAAGPAGQHWYTLQAAITPGFTSLIGVGLYDSSGGVFDQHATTATVPVGTADLLFNSCGSITMNYTFSSGPNAGLTGTLDLARVGPTPAGCAL